MLNVKVIFKSITGPDDKVKEISKEEQFLNNPFMCQGCFFKSD